MALCREICGNSSIFHKLVLSLTFKSSKIVLKKYENKDHKYLFTDT